MTDHLTTPEPHATEAPAPRRTPFRLPDEIGVIVALLIMVAVIGIARPRFLNPINLLTILGNTTFEGMLSLGMVFLLAIREIDLSVGWMFNFSAVIAALLMVAGVNPWLAALAGPRALSEPAWSGCRASTWPTSNARTGIWSICQAAN